VLLAKPVVVTIANASIIYSIIQFVDGSINAFAKELAYMERIIICKHGKLKGERHVFRCLL
jgi:1-deoxy-D-xylulose 5-phosphate reductoisomerase